MGEKLIFRLNLNYKLLIYSYLCLFAININLIFQIKKKDMKTLKPIVQVLSRYKMRDIDIIDNKDSTSIFTDFYRLIKEGNLKTDAEAEVYFFEKSKGKFKGSYHSFKSQFKKRLLNTLYFIDKENLLFNDFQKTYYSTQHEWGAINLLYSRNIIYAANQLAEQLLVKCIKYEFTDLCILILEKLKTTYADKVGNQKQYNDFRTQFWHYKKIWNDEHIAKEAFESIKINYVKSTANRPEYSQKAKEDLERLDELRRGCNSFIFLFYYFAVKEAIYSAQNKWTDVLIVCEEALYLFNNKPFKVKNYIAIFMNQKSISLLMLCRFAECEEILNEILDLQEVGNINWFKTMEKKVLLYFQTQNYIEAYNIYTYTRSIKEFKNLNGTDTEIWLLLEAYIYLALSLKKQSFSEKNIFESFKFAKFVNDLPIFSMDKKGMNVPVLIAKICLMVIEKKRNKFIDYVDALAKYSKRNISKKDTINYRTNLFIRAIVEINKAEFKRKVLIRHTEGIFKAMAQVPSTITEESYKIEIIPYEDLWAGILNSCD
jgi:hypothetical protein